MVRDEESQPPLRPGWHPQLPRVSPEALRLVAVTDEPGVDTDAWVRRVAAAVRGGATAVQVRAKETGSRTLLGVVRRLVSLLPVPVLVNDRVDIAIMAGAAGVHVGADDLPVAAIRAFTTPSFIIGASLGSLGELEASRGADYVGIGPAFASPSKADAGAPLSFAEISELRQLAGVPAIAIGGITAANIKQILEGCPRLAGIAMVSALFSAEDVESAARALRAAIGK